MPYCMSLKHKPLALLRAKKDHHNHRKLEEQEEQQQDVSLSVSSTTTSHKFLFPPPRQTQQREQQQKRLEKQQTKHQRRRRRRSFRRSVKRSIMMSRQQSIMDRLNIPIAPSSSVNNEWMEEVYNKDKMDVNSVVMTPGDRLLTSKLHLTTTSNSTNKYIVTEQQQCSLASLKTTSFQKEIRSAYHQKIQQQHLLTDGPTMMMDEEKKEDDFTTTMLSQSRCDDYDDCSLSQLKDQLQKTSHLLGMERSKNQALHRKLDRVTSEAKTAEEYLMGDHIDNFMETIVQLQNEVVALKGDVESYRDQYQQEKQHRKELQVRLNHSEQERKQMYDRMHLLMFEHLPAYSPKFNDIGPMDVSAEDVEGMIGQYSIVSKIGKGCFGDVFRAVTPRSRNEHCAIKCLKKKSFHRYKDVQQVAVEIHVLKNYPHPNIVGLVDVVHGPENICVAMELMQMDLHQYHDLMRRKSPTKQMSEQDAKQALYGILLPLAYLHSHGIAHLDIKPENVLLDWSTVAGNLTHYNIRLSDFGLVNMADKPSVTKDVTRKARSPIGTPGFYAPEMILGSKVEGRIADMWSVGCVAMELTLGFTPEWMEAYSAAMKDPADFSDGIESELNFSWEYEQMVENKTLSQMLDGLLQMDPASRLSAEQALAQAWLDDALFVANKVAVKMEMEPTGSPSKPIRKEAYDERSNFVGPPPGYGPI